MHTEVGTRVCVKHTQYEMPRWPPRPTAAAAGVSSLTHQHHSSLLMMRPHEPPLARLRLAGCYTHAGLAPRHSAPCDMHMLYMYAMGGAAPSPG